MTRSDILVETSKVIRENELTIHADDHINAMAETLDKFWLVMLALEKDSSFNKLGTLMRTIFEKEGLE